MPTPHSLKDGILNAIRTHGPMKRKELARAIKLGGNSRDTLRDALNALMDAGDLVKLTRGRFGLPGQSFDAIGRLEITAKGFGFVICEDAPGNDIFIAMRDMGTAMHGDTVGVELKRSASRSPVRSGKKRKRNGTRAPAKSESKNKRSGRIVQIIERGTSEIVGTYHRFSYDTGDSTAAFRPAGFIEPAARALRSMRVLVPADGVNGAEDNDRVVAKLIPPSNPRRERVFTAVVIDVLGEAGIASVEIEAICRQHNIRTEFPESVLREADAIPRDIPPDERARRKDFTGLKTVTIDPSSAKDFDDAVSLEQTADGDWVLFVHIADVSYYVTPGSEIDAEAYRRGTSVYLPGKTIPMLPEKLSNTLCSLNPHEDKLTRTCRMVFSSSGRMKSAKHYRSIIRSDARLSYTQVRQIVDGGEPELVSPEIFNLLIQMRDFSGILRKRRFREGALELEMDTVRLVLDEDKNEVRDVTIFHADWTHHLVEEFMLAANRAVAGYMMDAELAGLYRIHDDPDPEGLETLAHFARSLGFKIQHPVDRFSLQKLLDESRDSIYKNAIHFSVLTSMKKAVYSAFCSQHYALAFERYSHFTSPIRRYPDLVTHRQMLTRFTIDTPVLPDPSHRPHGAATERIEQTKGLVPVAAHCSQTERAAETAERDVTRFRQMLYLKLHPKDEHVGIITTINEHGFTVMLDDSKVEGWVPVQSLFDDYYAFNREKQSLTARRKNKRYRLGDTVRVRVAMLEITTRELELEVV